MNRVFKPEFLSAPRGFVKPLIGDDTYLEIGTGRGLHALQFAEQNPTKQLVAVERTRGKCSDFLQKAAKAQHENLTAVHADAIPWTVFAIPAQSLSGIFILYPNPEPKNPAQRWLNMPFFEYLLSRLKPNATITLASNIKDYIDEAESQAQSMWNISVQRENVALDSKRTHFEIKYLARGEVCENLIFSKPEGYTTRFDEYAERG